MTDQDRNREADRPGGGPDAGSPGGMGGAGVEGATGGKGPPGGLGPVPEDKEEGEER